MVRPLCLFLYLLLLKKTNYFNSCGEKPNQNSMGTMEIFESKLFSTKQNKTSILHPFYNAPEKCLILLFLTCSCFLFFLSISVSFFWYRIEHMKIENSVVPYLLQYLMVMPIGHLIHPFHGVNILHFYIMVH